MKHVLRLALQTYREEFWRVAGTAFIVFGITAALDAIATVLVIDHHVSRPFGAASISVIAGSISMAGVVVYAGILDKVVGAHLHGHPDLTMRQIFKVLPLGRLILADIVLAAATAIGLALFVIPGVIVFTLLALVGPVITIEDRALRDAFARSASLVRPHFWRAFILVTIPIQIEQGILHAIHYSDIFEHPAVPALFVNGLLGMVIGSIVGLIEVVLAYELIEHRRLERLPQSGSASS